MKSWFSCFHFSLNCGIVFLTSLGDAQSGGLLCSLFVFDWKAQVDCKLKFSFKELSTEIPV